MFPVSRELIQIDAGLEGAGASMSARWSNVCFQVAESDQKVPKSSQMGGKQCQKGAQKGQKPVKVAFGGLKESKLWSKKRFQRSKKGSNGRKGGSKGTEITKKGVIRSWVGTPGCALCGVCIRTHQHSAQNQFRGATEGFCHAKWLF